MFTIGFEQRRTIAAVLSFVVAQTFLVLGVGPSGAADFTPGDPMCADYGLTQWIGDDEVHLGTKTLSGVTLTYGDPKDEPGQPEYRAVTVSWNPATVEVTAVIVEAGPNAIVDTAPTTPAVSSTVGSLAGLGISHVTVCGTTPPAPPDDVPVTVTASVQCDPQDLVPTAACAPAPLLASLGDQVWFDADGNGLQHAAEPGVAGATVDLYRSDDTFVATTTTNASGSYLFADLEPGDYYIVFSVPTGYSGFTTQNSGNDALDSDADPATGRTALVSLEADEVDLTVDAGLLATPQCPLAATDGSLLLDLHLTPRANVGDYRYLLSTGAWRFGHHWVTASVPPGVYDITLVGFDYHSWAPPYIQLNEQFYLTGFTAAPGTWGQGSNLWADPALVVGPSYDVPDDEDYSAPATVSNVVVTEALTHFSTIHYSVVNGPVADAASVIPVCVRFSPVATEPLPAALGDFVWFDENGNGLQDDGEPGVPGATVNLWSVVDGAPGAIIATTTADADGAYLFDELDADDYIVQFVLPDGYDGFTTQNVGANDAIDSDPDATTGITAVTTLAWGETDLTVDAGVIVTPTEPLLASLGDVVWFDEDGDGLQGDDELGVAGVTVNLWSVVDGAPGAILATTTTDADGGYLFDELEAGDYIVQFVLPDGYDGFTLRDVGADDTIDSDPDPATGITAVVDLAWGETDLTVDAGLVVAPGATSAACAYTEIDIEGVPTMVSLITVTFAGVPGTLVDVLDGDTVVASATLGADGTGSVSFEAGTVTLRSSFAGVVIAEDGPTTFDPCPPDPELGAIGDRVWFDADRNGLQNPNTTLEPGIAGVTVHLYQLVGADFVPVAATVTDAEGYYLFDGLEAGEYQVLFVEPTSGYDGWTTANVGGDDAIDSDADPATGRSHIILLGEGQIDLTIDSGLVTIVLDEDEEDDDLPDTGFQSAFVALAGAIALGLGSLLVASTRRRDNEDITTT